ncbi:transmembrane protein 230 [Platysternon megacephalum]|uniref:Transmembrane protein 230 n=1 Tax=Platysternon megacephalum TaxID=55544 RepID=A0A4D9DWW7_9SAUR|nr:transmembrane protein 230 [Platysternon megacephalum]
MSDHRVALCIPPRVHCMKHCCIPANRAGPKANGAALGGAPTRRLASPEESILHVTPEESKWRGLCSPPLMDGRKEVSRSSRKMCIFTSYGRFCYRRLRRGWPGAWGNVAMYSALKGGHESKSLFKPPYVINTVLGSPSACPSLLFLALFPPLAVHMHWNWPSQKYHTALPPLSTSGSG